MSTARHLPTVPNRASPSTRVSETVLTAAIPLVASGPPPVPGYEIERELGRGGMGVVYLARQPEIDRPVALKMLRAGVLADDDARVRFTEEARVVARLRHPNVVQLYEAGEAHGQPYLALEYVAGPTLAAHAAGQPQPVAWAAELVEQLAAAIQYAHERGVIHRDLKPANVLLSGDGGRGAGDGRSETRATGSSRSAKIADFGLAKVLGDSPVQTQSGLTAGTPGYMAPEQVRGDRAGIGPWTDVYALGVILYELLTGRTPFPNLHPTAAMVATTETVPPPPRRFRPEIPRDLETVCLKCLAKSPRERYLTAAELAADLGRFRAGRPVLARRAGFAERTWKLARRNPVAASLTAALAVSLVIGFVAATVLWRQAEVRGTESEAARVRAETAEADAKAALAELTARQSDLAALNAFLLDDILAAPRPRGYGALGAGKGVTVREALDAAAGKITGRFAGKPALAAAAEHTLGESYRQMGEYPAAVRHLGRAVELRTSLNDPAGLAASRHRLAVALTSSGKEADALPLFRAALEGAEPKFAAKVRRDLGLCHVRRGDTAAAVAELTAVRDANRHLFGPAHQETISAINSLASAHTRANHHARVVELGREAVRLSAETEPDGVGMAYSLNSLGSGLSRAGELAEAEAILAKAAEMHGRHAGADHPDTVGMAYTLSRVLMDAQKWTDADDRLRLTIPLAATAFGSAHKFTCELRMMRVNALGRLGKVAECEAVALELLGVLAATPGVDPRDVKAVENTLAKIRAAKAKRPLAPPPRPRG